MKERLPVYAWVGVDPAETSVERYRELADAGFTHNLSFFLDAEAQARALDAAKAAGIRMIVNCPELEIDPTGTVRRFMAHPAVGGWYLGDEPSADLFDKLARWLEQIESMDKYPEHIGYINLLPNYATAAQLGAATYQEHVDRFIKRVPVKVVSFDHYPISNGTLRAEWYENLQIIADAARSAGKAFYGFALAVAHYGYPAPTLAHLRLQVYSNLAYGAQGIEYFSYWAPRFPGVVWHEAPIGKDGKRTVIYDRVRQMNEEIRGLSSVFLGTRVLGVWHTGSLPKGTVAYKPEAPIREVKADCGAVVSLQARNHQRWLVIVNRDFNQPMPLEVRWHEGKPVSRVFKDGNVSDSSSSPLRADVEPGDALILTWFTK
jgi:hypothetical protein